MKSNIIYIHTHDTGRVIQPYGYAVNTPNLMSFAKDAVLFKRAFCVSPTCSPSRSALLSGCYPHENGMLGLAQRGFQMDTSKHLVHYLNNHDYKTVLCGIQHESGWYLEHEKGATSLGYQEDITSPTEGYREEDLCEWDQHNLIAAVDYLKKYDQKKSLFLSFGMYATHRNYPEAIDEEIDLNYLQPIYPIPDTEENRHDHARFLTSLKSVDYCVGRLISALKEYGYYDNSIILFTTDHGLANPFSKCTLFDTGIGVSFMMRVPGMKTHGMVSESLISQIDFFPTLCDILELKKPKWLRGISFSSEFNEVNSIEENMIFSEINFHTSYEPARSIRNSRFKYIRYYDEEFLKINLSNIDSSTTKNFFLKNDLNQKLKYKEALYDLYYDIGERNNLINDNTYKEVIDELRSKLDNIMESSNDPLINGPIPIQKNWKVNKKECVVASSKNSEDYINF